VLGIATQALAQAVPDSTLQSRLTQTGTVTHRWAAPGTGNIVARSGDVWVTGEGSLRTPGDHTYNGWATSWADKLFVGNITNVDDGYWVLDRASCGYRIKADAGFVWSSILGTFERYRAETTATAELRGDFTYFFEHCVVLDNYSPTGTTQYDAQGGGVPPIIYPNGGSCSVKEGPGAFGVDGRETNDVTVSGSIAGRKRDDKLVVFYLYARGKQYMYNENEEDVSLATSISGAHSVIGWHGQIISYERLGGGGAREIRRHVLP